MKNNRWVCLDGAILKEPDAMIPAVQTGLFYGVGCFETMLFESGYIFRYEEHMNRMYSALRYLGLPEDLFPAMERMRQDIHHLIGHCGFENQRVRVRIQVSLIEKEGYFVDEFVKPINLITVEPVQENLNPAILFQTKTRVVPDVSRPVHFKLSNLLHYRNAFRKAQREGADDALMLTTNGFLAETATANIFWKKGNTIYTPSGLCDILPGIMRDAIIEIIENDDTYNLKEGKFYSTALNNAETVWLTNSVIEIRAVKSLDGKAFPIDEQFMSYLKGELKELKETGLRV